MKAFQLQLQYSYEEIQILKILAKFEKDAEKAIEIIRAGLNEYEQERIRRILLKFHQDGIWDLADEDDENGQCHSIFKVNFQDLILSHPNPLPKNLRSGINQNSILEKLPNSNLDPFEINFLSALIKNDISTNS